MFDGKGNTRKASQGWERRSFSPIRLKVGHHTIKLYCSDMPELPMQFCSLELVQSKVKQKMDDETQRFRSDTSWLEDREYAENNKFYLRELLDEFKRSHYGGDYKNKDYRPVNEFICNEQGWVSDK